MIFLLDNQHFYQTFDISSFDQIEAKIDTMAPSNVEYYLSDLASTVDSQASLNHSDIQYKVHFGEYCLMLDYGDNIYLEFEAQDDETESLW